MARGVTCLNPYESGRGEMCENQRGSFTLKIYISKKKNVHSTFWQLGEWVTLCEPMLKQVFGTTSNAKGIFQKCFIYKVLEQLQT
jgi:hypothetical protein